MEKSVSTKQKVCQSLLELLKTRNIHKITVREILAKSGISRSQFYRLFKDKYDLLNQAISLEVDRIFLENDSISITPDKLTALLQVTKDAYWSTSLCHNEYSELFYIYDVGVKRYFDPYDTRLLRTACSRNLQKYS